MDAAGDKLNMQSERITFGPVHLDIQSLGQSIRFWRDIVGLHLIETTGEAATLGIDGVPLVVLHASAKQSVQRGYSGLYHFAIQLPSEPELARVLARVGALHYPFGVQDHIIAKSIYVSDPDGVAVEITFETPGRVRSFQWDEGSPSALVIDQGGHRRTGIEPLDVEELLAVLPDHDIGRRLPSGTIVGHLHLQVGNLDASYKFYRDKIGLIPGMYAPWAHYGDLGAGGRVAHRIALNTWRGAGAPPRPLGVAGLRSFTLRFTSKEHFTEAVTKIGDAEARGQNYVARDPDGNVLVLVTQEQ
jgi:catechol 2,3-dioxygenase